MGSAATIALCLRYPYEGHRELVAAAVAGNTAESGNRDLVRFRDAVAGLSQGEWEELHTRTLDLSPQFVPYVGHAIWGGSYKRGAFMAELNAAMDAAGVDLGGELPDHLEPVLRYLDVAAEPVDELLRVLPKALSEMRRELKKSESKNPYRHVLAAAAEFAAEKLPVGSGSASEH